VFVWPSASQIDHASATFSDGLGSPEFSGDLRVNGHTLDLAVPDNVRGGGILQVGARSTPIVITCEGGIASCSVSLVLRSEFTLTVQDP
jgi:hypothetical protein